MRITRRVLASAFIGVAAASCLGSGSTAPELIGEGRRALFIGNSYLLTMDIPGIVQALADSAGSDRIAVATVARPDFALIDHWHEGTARRAVSEGNWEWVILQQGPSSATASRDTLRIGTRLFADAMTGGTPALFSAWPAAQRRQDFDRAIESYQLAAADVQGIFLPIASAWQAAWRLNPDLELYADGLHPSTEGAYLSALVVYGGLLGRSPRGLPNGVRTRSNRVVVVHPVTAELLQEAAAEALAQTPRANTPSSFQIAPGRRTEP